LQFAILAVAVGRSFSHSFGFLSLHSASRRIVDSVSSLLEATSTGSHCGGQATGLSSSASLLVTQGLLVTCGTKAAQNAVATPMRTTTRMLEVSLDLR